MLGVLLIFLHLIRNCNIRERRPYCNLHESAYILLYSGRSERNSYWGGGVETRLEPSEQNRGPGGLPLEKSFETTPFTSLEDAPFLNNLKDATDHN